MANDYSQQKHKGHMAENEGPALHYARPDTGELALRFSGDWTIDQGAELPVMEPLLKKIKNSHSAIHAIRFELTELGRWDTAFVAVLYHIYRECLAVNAQCHWQDAPEGVARLLELAIERSAPAEANAGGKPSLLEHVGRVALDMRGAVERTLEFIGEVTLSFGRLLKHKAYFRKVDFVEALADVGPRALPIVTLISFLVGLILAFVGSMQLQTFGAQIFVADLVGIAMAREMGAMMTGIIMAGRTSASYAARLGTMQVNEEIDALRTNGIHYMDFLTLPRILALVIMMPILCLYADAIGILGGMTIGVFMLDLSPVEYWHETVEAISLNDCWAGLIKGVVFAFVVGLAGCYHGLRCGRSSEAVGNVTTVAVVSAIVFIIITDSVLTVVYDIINF